MAREQRRVSSRLRGKRRFPPPWSVEETEACFIVIDGTEQKLGIVTQLVILTDVADPL